MLGKVIILNLFENVSLFFYLKKQGKSIVLYNLKITVVHILVDLTLILSLHIFLNDKNYSVDTVQIQFLFFKNYLMAAQHSNL